MVVTHICRMRWFGHVELNTGWIAEVRKTNCTCTEETRQVLEWVEVLVDDGKKLGMVLALRIVLSGEDNFEEDLSTKTNPR